MTLHHRLSALAPAAAAVLLALTPCAAGAAKTPAAPGAPPPAPASTAQASAAPQARTSALPSTVTAPPPAPDNSGPAAPSNATTSALIHPGDQLAIAVYGSPELTQTTIVQHDGTIQYPLIGRVMVGGQTPAEARDVVAAALGKYLKHPAVTLSVAVQGQMSVTVMGNVKNSGKYPLRNSARLSEALAASGGVATLNGDYPMVRVLQPDGGVVMANLQKLLHDGDSTQNVELGDNAIVYVTGAEIIRVQVLGAVSRPGNVEINVGDRLSMALARAGVESAAKPDLNRVSLTRRDPSTGKAMATYQFDMFQYLQKGDQRYDPILQKDDTIYIPEARQVSPALIGILGIFGRLLGF
jgi:polysaccharide export outer membrane protein